MAQRPQAGTAGVLLCRPAGSAAQGNQHDGADGAARCFRTRQADGDLAVLLVESLAEAKIPNRPSAPQIDALCRGGAAK